jgi:hypothetical protein
MERSKPSPSSSMNLVPHGIISLEKKEISGLTAPLFLEGGEEVGFYLQFGRYTGPSCLLILLS